MVSTDSRRLELARINVAKARGAGIAQGATELAVKSCTKHGKTFGKPICKHQAYSTGS